MTGEPLREGEESEDDVNDSNEGVGEAREGVVLGGRGKFNS